MTSPGRQAIRVTAPDLTRLAAVLCIAAALTLSLGMLFPVQYQLDTAGYRGTSAQASAPISAMSDEVVGLREALGGEETAVFIDFFTAAYKDERVVGNVSLWALLGDVLEAEVTLMPDATRVAGDPRDAADHGDWIDINADIASRLQVGLGDRIALEVGGQELATFTVRGIYAARLTGASGLAHISAKALARHDPTIDLMANSVVSAASPERVEAVLNAPGWRERMSEIHAMPVEADSIREQLEEAEQHAFVSFPLVLGLSGIAVTALLAIVISEVAAFVRAFHGHADLLIDLGARPSRMHLGLLTGVGVAATVALTSGSAIGTVAYTTGFAGPTIPPAVFAIWASTTAVSVAVAVATATGAALIQRRSLFR